MAVAVSGAVLSGHACQERGPGSNNAGLLCEPTGRISNAAGPEGHLFCCSGAWSDPMSTAGGRLRATVGDPRWAALAGSLGYLALLAATWHWAYGLSGLGRMLVSAQVGPWLWWAALGGATVGGVAAAFAADRLVSPATVVALTYGLVVYRMWQLLRRPEVLLPGTPLDLYLVGWPVVLGLAVAAGRLERRVRERRPASDPVDAP